MAYKSKKPHPHLKQGISKVILIRRVKCEVSKDADKKVHIIAVNIFKHLVSPSMFYDANAVKMLATLTPLLSFAEPFFRKNLCNRHGIGQRPKASQVVLLQAGLLQKNISKPLESQPSERPCRCRTLNNHTNHFIGNCVAYVCSKYDIMIPLTFLDAEDIV